MKMRGKWIGAGVLAMMLLAAGCGGEKKSTGAAEGAGRGMVAHERTASEAAGAAVRAGELPLPVVPEGISDPGERAAYAVTHFWDALDVADHSLSLDTAFMEQSFANFIGLLHYAPADAREKAIGAFIDRCVPDKTVYDLAVYLSQLYLDDPNSPMRNEEIFIPFLKRYAEDSRLPEATRVRSQYRLVQAMKNRPGTKAADIRLIMRDGRTSTMLGELRDTTLVFFYDYDCDHCKETVARLQDPMMGVRYPIMAIEVTGHREGWDATKATMPGNWNVGFATESLDGETYDFPALPSLYLLTAGGTVLIKDASL